VARPIDNLDTVSPRRRKLERQTVWPRVAALVAATVVAFLPALTNEFINWDDPYALTGNPKLGEPGVVAWAFSTTLMGHYQPLAWVAWSALGSLFGVRPFAFHAASLLTHVINVALMYVVAVRLASGSRLDREQTHFVAFLAALLFAIHPLRVEPVAWASAFPYLLSLAWLLAATLAYLQYCSATSAGSRRAWYGAAVLGYLLSLLSRSTAIGYPLVLLVLDVYPLARITRGLTAERPHPVRRERVRNVILEKAPFAFAACAAAFMELRSREIAPLEEIGAGARVVTAASAPFVYIARTLLPIGHSAVDPLPIAPRPDWAALALALGALAAVTMAGWMLRRKWPVLLTAWVSYLLLLAPSMGLTPSGQTGVADRYTYVSGVVLSLLIAAAAARIESISRIQPASIVVVTMLGVALGTATWRQTRWWHDSISFWTRAIDLDETNDIATFNLAVALEHEGRKDEAIERYAQTLALIPAHEPARLASTRLRAERGLVLARGGRFADAAADLRPAFEARPDDLVLANALSFALAQIDRSGEAVMVLKQSLARHPDNDEVAHNLARLLATSSDAGVRDGALALRLALAVRERTGGRDPRVLDTLAAAYSAAGQPEAASRTASEAAALARQAGDAALAAEIASHPWSDVR
jgi:tetratricopeptide (TPR) repeat protein